MKKKILAFLLAISCVLSATACGAQEAEKPVEASETEAESEEESGEEESKEDEVEEPEVEEESEAEEEPEEEKDTKKPTASSGALSDDLYDFQISIDGTVYQFPMFYSDFEALGWEYDGDPTNTLSSNQYTAVEI